jgi:hypothetical protein
VNVPTWAIALLTGLVGTVLGLAVSWGAHKKTVSQLEKDVLGLSTAIKELSAKVEALTIALAEQRGIEKGREQTGKHPVATN